MRGQKATGLVPVARKFMAMQGHCVALPVCFCREPSPSPPPPPPLTLSPLPPTGPRSEQALLPLSICVWADVRPQLALRSHHQAFSVEEKAPGSSLEPPSLGHLVQALPRGPLFSVGCSQNIDPRGDEMRDELGPPIA